MKIHEYQAKATFHLLSKDVTVNEPESPPSHLKRGMNGESLFGASLGWTSFL